MLMQIAHRMCMATPSVDTQPDVREPALTPQPMIAHQPPSCQVELPNNILEGVRFLFSPTGMIMNNRITLGVTTANGHKELSISYDSESTLTKSQGRQINF